MFPTFHADVHATSALCLSNPIASHNSATLVTARCATKRLPQRRISAKTAAASSDDRAAPAHPSRFHSSSESLPQLITDGCRGRRHINAARRGKCDASAADGATSAPPSAPRTADRDQRGRRTGDRCKWLVERSDTQG